MLALARQPRDRLFVWACAAIALALHLALAGRYDLMRNELYFLVCGRRPDFAYVDQPALVPLLAAATQAFGLSPFALRLPAAFAGAALVPLVAAFARLLGGGPVAAALAAAAALLCPVLLALTDLLTTSTFEPLAWTAIAYWLARDDRNAPIWAGLIAGVAMEAKWAAPIWLLGLGVGLLATPERRLFSRRELWIGVGLAALIAAPGAIWQAAQGWPFLEVMRRHNPPGGDFNGSPIRFFITQALATNPALALLWIAGIVAPFLMPRLRSARFLSIGYVVAFTIDYVAHGKVYYLFPAYPTLFAIGAAAVTFLPRIAVAAWIGLAAALTAVVAPIVLPILAPEQLARYLDATHLRPPPDEAAAAGAPLTQAFSDEFGWRELANKVADVYRALPPDERARAAILTQNYGEAAAIDVYGAAEGLPPAISGQNQYFLWGSRGYDGSVLIHVNGDPEAWRRRCTSVEVAATFGVAYAMSYETNRPIFVCRGLRTPLTDVWSRFRSYR